MRRVLALVALAGLSAGCTLHSNPASDSVARTERAKAAEALTVRAFGPAMAGAPTLRFHAPATAVVYDEVDVPEGLQAGVANIELTSLGNHNVAIAGPDIPVALVLGELAGKPVEGLTRSVELSTGTYVFYCSVQGHRDAGMKGTFTVG